MSNIKFYCEKCDAKLGIDSQYSGTKIDCPDCKTKLLVPSSEVKSLLEIDNYILEKKMTDGRMGEIWLANDSKKNIKVIINILSPGIITKGDFLDDFKKEVLLSKKMINDNIVANYQYNYSSGYYYLVMDYLDAMTLKQRAEIISFSESDALTIMFELANSLKYTWNKFHLIHGDLKNTDILIEPSGKVKILNLGILKTFLKVEKNINDNPIDFRTDIYKLGLIIKDLYKNNDISNNLTSLLDKMTAPDINDRHQSIEDLIFEIERVMQTFTSKKKSCLPYNNKKYVETPPQIKKKEKNPIGFIKLIAIGIAICAVLGILAMLLPTDKIENIESLDSLVNTDFQLPEQNEVFEETETIINIKEEQDDSFIQTMYQNSENFYKKNPTKFIESIDNYSKIVKLYSLSEYAQQADAQIAKIKKAQQEYIEEQNKAFLKKQKDLTGLKKQLSEDAKILQDKMNEEKQLVEGIIASLLSKDIFAVQEDLNKINFGESVDELKLIVNDIINENSIIKKSLKIYKDKVIDLSKTNKKWKNATIINIDEDNITFQYFYTGTKLMKKINVSDLSNYDKITFFQSENEISNALYAAILSVKDENFDAAQAFILKTGFLANNLDKEIKLLKQRYEEKTEEDNILKAKEIAIKMFTKLQNDANRLNTSIKNKEILMEDIQKYKDKFPGEYSVELDSMIFDFNEKLGKKQEKESKLLYEQEQKRKSKALRKKIRTLEELIEIMKLFNPNMKIKKMKRQKNKNQDRVKYGDISNRNGLWYIDLSNSTIINIDPLLKLKIRNLVLANNPISTIPENLQVSSYLNIEGTQITDLSPLKSIRSLNKLKICGLDIKDILSLKNVSVKSLILDAQNLKNIENISEIGKCKKLEEIIVMGGKSIKKYTIKSFLERDKSKDPEIIIEETEEEGNE